MNCREFDDVVVELARAQCGDASRRASAAAHAESCARCAARLERERELTARLRALATEDAQAPARVEIALRAAFGRHTAAAPPAMPRHWPAWALAAAAVIVLAAAIAIVRAPRTSPPGRAQTKGAQPSPAAAARVQSPEPKPEAPAGQPARPRGYGSREIVTGFYPLEYGVDVTALEAAPLVRMKLPRMVLASVGLPMNPDRAGEPVQADVVVGADGLARAVRFVGQTPQD